MKTRIIGSFTTVAIAAVLLAGCVSSKKYKASQASLQQMRSDSIRCGQEVISLNQSLQSLEQKNTNLKQSLDSSSRSYAIQQKNLDYYQTYFSKQQTTLSQVGQELRDALTQAGISNENVQQMSDGITISLDENSTFKNNSVIITTAGQQALNNVATVLKNHPDVNVTVTIGDEISTTSSSSGAADNMSATSSSVKNKEQSDKDMPVQKSAVKKYKQPSTTKTESTNPSTAPAERKTKVVHKSSTASNNHAVVKHKTRHTASEGFPTSYSYNGKAKRSSPYLRTARVNTVANSLVKNGIPKVNVLIQEPAVQTDNTKSTKGTIKIIVSPTMNDLNPAKNTSASRIQ